MPLSVSDIVPARHNLDILYQSLEAVNNNSYNGFVGGIPTTPNTVFASESNSAVGFVLNDVGTLETGEYETDAKVIVDFHSNGSDHESHVSVSRVEVINTTSLKSITYIMSAPVKVEHDKLYIDFRLTPILTTSASAAGRAVDAVKAVPTTTKRMIISANKD